MRPRSSVKEDLRGQRREFRFNAIVQSADRLKGLTPAKKLDAATDLIRDAWSLRDAAEGTLARRRR